MSLASRTPSVAMRMTKLTHTCITKAAVRANSSISGRSVDERPRNWRPSGRFTIFTGPDITKRSVISKITSQVHAPSTGPRERAAVILASPRHASWLTDESFMADLVSSLEGPPIPGASAVTSSFHVVAAVVDGLSPRAPSRELQEGLSIQLGYRNRLLPGLWDTTEPQDGQPTLSQRADSEPSSALSILLPRRMTAKNARISLTLPLANTLFQNGRRSTLLVSEWRQSEADGTPMSRFKLAKMAEKRSQVIDLPSTVFFDSVNIRAPLAPVTQPRKVMEALGNILAKIEVKGELSPASMELQANIPRLLEARGALSQSDSPTGRPGVWAVIYPKHMFRGDEDLVRFYRVIGGRSLGTALDKLVFDFSTDTERMAWELQPAIRNAVFRGARLHRILSGGGEWGTKASLLSLDPQTSHGRKSEKDELDTFVKSFHRDEDVKDALVKPGDYVQFFVERDPVQLAPERKQNLYMQATDYPTVLFGVGDMNLKDLESPYRSEKPQAPAQPHVMNWIAFDHFGGHSAEGIYLSAGTVGPNTKLDVPGASVSMSSTESAATSNAPYLGFKRVYDGRDRNTVQLTKQPAPERPNFRP